MPIMVYSFASGNNELSQCSITMQKRRINEIPLARKALSHLRDDFLTTQEEVAVIVSRNKSKGKLIGLGEKLCCNVPKFLNGSKLEIHHYGLNFIIYVSTDTKIIPQGSYNKENF